MAKIEQLITRVRALPNCMVYPSVGMPSIEKGLMLPQDVHSFYELCGGIELYTNAEFPIRIVFPQNFEKANPVIIGYIPELPNGGIEQGDMSENWYIIADDFNGDYLIIDLNENRIGRCYDGFHELYPGDCPIISMSFTELLEKLIENNGERWYWLQEGFTSMGNAYDEV